MHHVRMGCFNTGVEDLNQVGQLTSSTIFVWPSKSKTTIM